MKTFVGWGIPAKDSKPGEYTLYEAGVMQYLNKELSLYQTITVTQNAISPSQTTKENIAPNIIGAEEKVDIGTKA